MSTLDLGQFTRMLVHGAFSGGPTSVTLDASTEYAYFAFEADRDGSIDKVEVTVNSVTGTSPTYLVGIEANSSSAPGGTWLGATNNGYGSVTPTAGGRYDVTLGESVTVTKGTKYFVVIRYGSGTIGASNRSLFGFSASGRASNYPFVGQFTGGSTSNSTTIGCVSVGYDTGDWLPNMAAFTVANQSWSSSSSPKWRGTLFVAPFTFTCKRLYTAFRLNTNGDFKIVIVKGSASSSDHETTVDADSQLRSATNTELHELSATYQFEAGETYRIFIEPTSATAINVFNKYTFTDAARRAAFAGIFSWTTATALGTNTDDSASCCPLIPVVEEITVAASGGGRVGFGSFG